MQLAGFGRGRGYGVKRCLGRGIVSVGFRIEVSSLNWLQFGNCQASCSFVHLIWFLY